MKTLELTKQNKQTKQTNALYNANIYAYNSIDLQEKINRILDKIEKWVKYKDYRIIGDLSSLKNLNQQNNINLSINRIKNINKYLNSLDRKITLRKVNTFLHLIYKTYKLDKKVNIKIGIKEETIQKKRKEWLKARDEAEKLLKAYKDEKGSFYKDQL